MVEIGNLSAELSSYSELLYTTNIIACIPAYNEEPTILDVINTTENFVKKVIVCNDGSVDNTSELIRSTQAILISQKKKMGKGYSLRTLFREAIRYDPEVIIKLCRSCHGRVHAKGFPNPIWKQRKSNLTSTL